VPDISIEQIITSLSYFGIFLLMISNGVVSFPSSQILYIITGYFIFTGDLGLLPVIIAGAVGNTIGNIVLYELVRAKGVGYIEKITTKLYQIPKEKFERNLAKVQIAFQKKGAWFVFIGKLIPALKVFIPIPAGLAKMNRALYSTTILIASTIWTLPFIAIGYYFGKSSDVFGKYAIALILVALVVLAVFYKYINSEKVVSEIEGVVKQ
jgi:membrane protein DedA with SNARE-associated domain